MVKFSRIESAFSTEAEFLDAARASIRAFKFETGPVENKRFTLKVAGHTTGAKVKIRDWKLFRGKDWRTGPYEAPVVAVTDFLISRFNIRTVYDVGADKGFHALMAATLEGHDTNVHAFEMQPLQHKYIAGLSTEIAEVKGRLFAHLAGLSDHHRGERTIWYTRRNMFETRPDPREAQDALHRRIKFWWLGRENRGNIREATVLITTLDRFAQDTGTPPDLIKLDVDGYEAKVIPGALQTLADRPFVLFELHKDERLARFGVKRRDVVAPLFDRGYRAALFTNHNDHKTCDLTKVERDDPSFGVQATTMYLFY